MCNDIVFVFDPEKGKYKLIGHFDINNDNDVIDSLDKMIKVAKDIKLGSDTVEFWICGSGYNMHPKQYKKWFLERLEEYHKKTGYKVNWVKKNVYTINLLKEESK